jgi:hypothetical protein
MTATPDGVPTIIELKRADNGELRGMLVGQLVDYAAALRYGAVERIRQEFEQRVGSEAAQEDEYEHVLDGGNSTVLGGGGRGGSLPATVPAHERPMRRLVPSVRTPSDWDRWPPSSTWAASSASGPSSRSRTGGSTPRC